MYLRLAICCFGLDRRTLKRIHRTYEFVRQAIAECGEIVTGFLDDCGVAHLGSEHTHLCQVASMCGWSLAAKVGFKPPKSKPIIRP